MSRKKPLFVRKDTFKKSRLGRRRKKKQKWRRPRGRHSKLREKRKGYTKQPSIGYSNPKKIRGLINGMKPKIIVSASELTNIGKNEICIVGRVGKKKKIEIAKKAIENKIRIFNFNPETYLKKIEEEEKEKIKTETKKVEEKTQGREEKEANEKRPNKEIEQEKIEKEN